MFGSTLMRATGLVRNARYFRSTVALRDSKSATTENATKQPREPGVESVLGTRMHKCSNFDKWLLVWTKKYPSKDQVPDKVPAEQLHQAQSKGRVRTANLMIVIIIIGCFIAVASGKRDAKAGKSLSRDNQEWHAQINKDFKDSKEVALKSK